MTVDHVLAIFLTCALVLVLGALAVFALGRAADYETRCMDGRSVASGLCEPTP